ncbi:MAG: TIGR04282 family arsenosugar biosynthesis glycosyltransferase [Flavobacteriales bacterium]|jgi:rSAM/selenodomain-associated transferase 1|nr:TIGR04282 family arsenosugar biosynthesis glycosyltransferase [Flavobacteriales bacterium]
MTKNLIIVFVKNLSKGKVKTRLAKTIGDENALKVYKALLEKTQTVVENLLIDSQVHFSEKIADENWDLSQKFVQVGDDLGARMQKAFQEAFQNGYEKIVLIGSDLPSISSDFIQEAFQVLEQKELVFGPAEDGGYYLIGMKNMYKYPFENKAWSTPSLLDQTRKELAHKKISYGLLSTLNDIDTFEDLKQYPEFLNIITDVNKTVGRNQKVSTLTRNFGT